MQDEDQKSVFMTWLGEHGSSVVKVARAYTLTSDECQDLAQEILLQAWRSLPNFEGKASPATWFYRVALHTAMNWKRKDNPRRSRQQPLLEVQAVATEGCDSAERAQHRETVEQDDVRPGEGDRARHRGEHRGEAPNTTRSSTQRAARLTAKECGKPMTDATREK